MTSWHREARFGLFLHWGLYSVAGRHEWVKYHEHRDDVYYDRYVRHFTADRFDPDEWAELAYRSGMRYAVLTAKHHEGFCLWDSALTDYKATNTPARRDLVEEFVTAFRRRGLRVGLYYSLIDWHHPAFGVDAFHPQYDPTLPSPLGGGSGDEYRAYLHGQVRELVEAFRPDLLWFDFSYPDGSSWTYPSRIGELPGKGAADWGSAELVQMVRELQPEILINDRLDLPASADFVTPEEVVPEVSEAKYGSGVLRESCRTLNGSWGYAPSFQSWLDAGQVVRLLVDSVSRGDNLLLNVGPTARGQIEPKARRLLAEVGDWMDDHGAAVHGAEAGDLPAPRDCRITKSGDRRFLHVFAWPSGQLALSGLPAELEFACFVHDGAEVELPTPPAAEMVVLKLPLRQPDVAVPVIELFFRGS